jgi:tetratricopeptide (TPR) repeat protein
MHIETPSRAAFELVNEALGRIDLFQQTRDRQHLQVAHDKLDRARQRDQNYLKAIFYSGIVDDLLGKIGPAISSFETVLKGLPKGADSIRNEVRYNYAVSLYHRYSRSYLEQAESEFLALLDGSASPLLECLAQAGLAQTYAMMEIPRKRDERDAMEEEHLEDCFQQSIEMSELALAGADDVEDMPEDLRQKIRATALNAQGMALMYYTDYREEKRIARLEKALEVLQQAEELNPGDWANVCDLASCSMRLGFWLRQPEPFETCRSLLRRVIDVLRPGYGFAWYEIGRSFRIQGKFREALDAFAHARAVPSPDRDVSDGTLAREEKLAEAENARYP